MHKTLYNISGGGEGKCPQNISFFSKGAPVRGTMAQWPVEACVSQCRCMQGPGACDACVSAKDGMFCVPACPPCKYRDDDGECQWCHPNCGKDVGCSGAPRCTGPGAHLGYGGCTECGGLLLDNQAGLGSTECLNRTIRNCERGFYFFGGTIEIPSNTSRRSEFRRVVSP